MAVGNLPTAPEDYYGDRYRELNSQLAKRQRSAKRESAESLAARGALHSGMTNTTERSIEGNVNELWHQGARDIENMRWQADQTETDRQHALRLQANQFGENAAQRGWQTGEREGTQLFATGEREGTQLFATGEREGTQLFATGEREGAQQWQSGESEAERQARLEIQKMSDAARYELQELVNSGQMTLQEAEQKWTSYESDLNRQLEWNTTTGQWTQETDVQTAQFVQDTLMAEFGAETALAMQNDAQFFEEFMAGLGREWELDDRPWLDAQATMDRQLQMLAAGYDWLDDNYLGGLPSWMVLNPEEGVDPTTGTQYTYSPPGGAPTSAQPGWTAAPWLDKDGNPTDDPGAAVGDNPNYTGGDWNPGSGGHQGGW